MSKRQLNCRSGIPCGKENDKIEGVHSLRGRPVPKQLYMFTKVVLARTNDIFCLSNYYPILFPGENLGL